MISYLRKAFPFLRWSVIRLALSNKRLEREWQVGDGREQAALQWVLQHARKGDVDSVIATIDEFAYKHSFLINVGDAKGGLLDTAILKQQPKLALELGAYVGYSALRTGRVLPKGSRLISIEFNEANAAIARQMIEYAGLTDRVTVVSGFIGDGGKTIERLEREFGIGPGKIDFVFVDHAKDAYLPDLKTLLALGWLSKGAVVVADNVKFPGAPDYHAYMREQEGRNWRSIEHKTHAEYQTLIKDIVLESTYLG
jgi:catechol O-methyltransferase